MYVYRSVHNCAYTNITLHKGSDLQKERGFCTESRDMQVYTIIQGGTPTLGRNVKRLVDILLMLKNKGKVHNAYWQNIFQLDGLIYKKTQSRQTSTLI